MDRKIAERKTKNNNSNKKQTGKVFLRFDFCSLDLSFSRIIHTFHYLRKNNYILKKTADKI